MKSVCAGVVALLVTFAAGCGGPDAAAPDAAVAPDALTDLPARYPGPCTSSHDEGGGRVTVCTATYDEAGLLTTTECDTRTNGLVDVFGATTREYEELRLARMRYAYDDGQAFIHQWAFAATGAVENVQVVGGNKEDRESRDELTYEAEGLVLAGHPAEIDLTGAPSAPDALLRHYQTYFYVFENRVEVLGDVTYTYDGPPRTGTRTRTGSDGSVRSFVYDAAARLIEDRGDLVTTFAYDGDRLVAVQVGDTPPTSYLHDGPGNLRRRTDPDGSVTEYGYDCW